jgi:hypothetical protein
LSIGVASGYGVSDLNENGIVSEVIFFSYNLGQETGVRSFRK